MKVRLPKNNANNIQNIQKMAQKMQNDVAELNHMLDEKIYIASVGGGSVEVIINGRPELQSIRISPEIIDINDVSLLEDTICAGVNEALKKSSEDREMQMSAVTGNFNLPGLF